jgi:activator of 2-hydroxyglutaryl-CoA dehydratase
MVGNHTLAMGLDIGSTTVKAVLWDGGEVCYQEYRRHRSDILGELTSMLGDMSHRFPGASVCVSVTGSGGSASLACSDCPLSRR